MDLQGFIETEGAYNDLEADKQKEVRVRLIELAETHCGGMKINTMSGIDKIRGHIQDYFEELANPTPSPYSGEGLVKVVGVTVPYVGTGLTGEANKIFLGKEAILPQSLAGQLIEAGQVKEIK